MKILSDRASAWVKRQIERVLDRFYEGPTPPERLGKMAEAFAAMHPHATRAEWIAFAVEHGNECYRSGFIRGFENAERDPDVLYTQPTPEEIADAIDPRWRDDAYDWDWQPDLRIDAPDGVVVDHESDPIEALLNGTRGRV